MIVPLPLELATGTADLLSRGQIHDTADSHLEEVKLQETIGLGFTIISPKIKDAPVESQPVSATDVKKNNFPKLTLAMGPHRQYTGDADFRNDHWEDGYGWTHGCLDGVGTYGPAGAG